MYIFRTNIRRITLILVNIIKLLTRVFPPENCVWECLSSTIFSPVCYVTRIFIFANLIRKKRIFYDSLNLYLYHEWGFVSFHMIKGYLNIPFCEFSVHILCPFLLMYYWSYWFEINVLHVRWFVSILTPVYHLYLTLLIFDKKF